MRVVFFHFLTGTPIRVVSGQENDIETAVNDPRYSGCPVRFLDDTPYENALYLDGLPNLAEFDEAVL